MTRQPVTLYYVHDPMCSWCWGFAPVWQQVHERLADSPVQVKYLLGGLAPDSDQPMAQEMQATLQNVWRRIQQHIPGTEFNFDFWRQCQPRRSTWPACRAVLAAGNQQQAQPMISAIQQAYYLRAMNPSDDEVLVQLAVELGLDGARFTADLNSAETHAALQQQMQLAHSMPINGFPSLVLQTEQGYRPLPLDYHSAQTILDAVAKAVAM